MGANDTQPPDPPATLAGVSAYQRDMLAAIGELYATQETAPNGADVHAAVGPQHPGASKSRTYRNLDELVFLGLIVRTRADGRAFAYRLTPEGRNALATHVAMLARGLHA